LSLALEEVRGLLVSLLPPGASDFYDIENADASIYKFFAGLADSFKLYGFDVIDLIRTEFMPSTCVQKLPDWEAALGLAGSLTAATGSNSARQAAIMAKLRESGASTLDNVRATIAPLLGYADPADLVIYEPSRAAQKAAHSYGESGMSVSFTTSAAVRSLGLHDGGWLSAASVQLSLTLTHSDMSLVTVVLTAPSGATITWTSFATGSASSTTYVLYGLGSSAVSTTTDGLVGESMPGDWSVSVSASSGTGTLIAWSLFAEGIGGKRGLGESMFEWAVYADPLLVNSPDYVAVRAALQRIKPAQTLADLLLSIDPIPDNNTTIPDGFIPA